jgi:SAM-dependent methyltransferase
LNLAERLHDRFGQQRRVHTLVRHFAPLVDRDATLLDVGCGDGLLARTLSETRPDVRVEGIDVLPRPDALVHVTPFDGREIPYADASFDCVMFVDVLHHCDDPDQLLREARRVARHAILIKDHTLEGFFAGATLRFMDRLGNARYGVALPYNYWRLERWQRAIEEHRLEVGHWETRLGLYPGPLDAIFGRSLHFVAALSIPREDAAR